MKVKRVPFRRKVADDKFVKAYELRKSMTESERILWEHLRARRLDGHKFRSQSVILGYIADFYFAPTRLVVELDGSFHLNPERKRKDDIRDAAMKRSGFRVLRIESKRVFLDLDGVLSQIRDAIPAPGYGKAALYISKSVRRI